MHVLECTSSLPQTLNTGSRPKTVGIVLSELLLNFFMLDILVFATLKDPVMIANPNMHSTQRAQALAVLPKRKRVKVIEEVSAKAVSISSISFLPACHRSV